MAVDEAMNLPGPPMDAMFPDVKPVPGELLRFRVASRSRSESWLVDLAENGFYGWCGCEAFQLKYSGKLKLGIPTDGRFKCYHIKRAEAYFVEEMKRTLWTAAHLQVKQVETCPWPPQ